MVRKYKYIDLSYINYTALGNKSLKLDLINMFITESQLTENEMLETYAVADWIKLHKLAHKAKNELLIIGAKDLAEKMKDLQIWCEFGTNSEKYNEYVTAFVQGIKEIIQELEIVKKEEL